MNPVREAPHVLLVGGSSTTRRWIGRSAMALLLGVGGVGLAGMIGPAPTPYLVDARGPEPGPVAPPAMPAAPPAATPVTVAQPAERSASREPAAAPRNVVPKSVARRPDPRARQPVAPITTPDTQPLSVLPPAQLFVSSRPWGHLYVNGRLVGTTPMSGLALSPGPHQVRILRDGFQPYERSVTVAPAQVIRLVDVVLEELRP